MICLGVDWSKAWTDLVSAGQPVCQLLQATHHPLVPEVVREGFCPLGQQLEDLWSDLPDSHLKYVDQYFNVDTFLEESSDRRPLNIPCQPGGR